MADSEPWITLQRSSEEALGLFRDPGREAYVAVTHGQPCGFVLIMMQGAFAGYVQSLGVAPDFRGRGIGSRLMGFAETRIFRESPNVFVCVSSFNMDARRLYERLGYAVIGELTDYIVEGHAEILLRKSLGSLRNFQPLP